VTRHDIVILLVIVLTITACGIRDESSTVAHPRGPSIEPMPTPEPASPDSESPVDSAFPRESDAFPHDVLHRAVMLTARKHYDQAEALLTPPIEARHEAAGDTGLAEAFFWRAYCREHTGRPNAAIQDYETVVRRFPAAPAASQAARRLHVLVR
jgi:hypothetical protein